MNNHAGPGKYTLERFFAGELDEKSSGEVRAHLQTCRECTLYVRDLELEKDGYLSKHPYRDWAASNVQVAEISWGERVKSWFVKPAFYPLYGLALILCIAVPVVINQKDPAVSYKGNQALSFVFKRNGVVSDGSTEKLFQQGDQIQVSYSFPEDHYVALLSIDSKGTVSTYQAASGGQNLTVHMNGCGNCIVPQSIILDNTSGGELVILLVAKRDLPLDEVRSWAETLLNEKDDLTDVEKRVHQNVPRNVIECRTLLLQKR
jgi:hypothetical protein